MKNTITLTKETLDTLRRLYNEIDEEMNKPCVDCNIDTVTENQIQIYDTIKKLIF